MHINFLLLSFVFNFAYKDKNFKKDKNKNEEAIWKGLFENRFGRGEKQWFHKYMDEPHEPSKNC